MAARQRPDLRNLMLRIAKAETERDLAKNQVMPEVNLVVEAASSLSDGPYKDREDFELFVGGELKLPLQRRGARGKLQQATAALSRLMIEQRYARDRIINQIQDTRSALQAVSNQLEDTKRNVTLADELVIAEQRAFDLGRSDLLRVQLREVQLADARVMAIEARMAFQMAHADYRAALGFADSK
jgi:outer membrane protein TolC